MRRREDESLAATTTSRSAAKREPMFLREEVSRAVNIPPNWGEEKKVRWRGGVRPRGAPRSAPRSGALMKLQRVAIVLRVAEGIFFYCFCDV